MIGAIPHFEDTREDGVRSLEIAVDIAVRHGLMLDAHCDEIDDEQSRFAEVLATLAARSGLRARATASHTTAMGSYNPAYALKLERILARSGVNLVCNPMVNLHLQGRLDDYPKRRGLTRVKEILAAGINVAFGHDDIMDPWYPLGTGNPVQVAFVGAHATQLTSPGEVAECFRMVTDRAAAVLSLGEEYGIVAGRPASFVAAAGQRPVRRDPAARPAVPCRGAREAGGLDSAVGDDPALARAPGRAGGFRPPPRGGQRHLAGSVTPARSGPAVSRWPGTHALMAGRRPRARGLG